MSILNKLLTILLTCSLLVACGSKNSSKEEALIGQQQSNGDITLINAYIPYRNADQQHFAAYFDIKNTSNKSISIVGVNSPAFAHSMLHETVFEENMAKMKSIEPLTIAPNQAVTFKPKGKHVMLMKSIRDLSKQDGIKLNVALDTGESLQFEIDFKKSNTQ